MNIFNCNKSQQTETVIAFLKESDPWVLFKLAGGGVAV